MFKTSDQTDKLDAAMAKMQAELKPAIKDKQNPHFRSDYLTLSGAVDSARDALAKHGLNVTQWPIDSADGRVHLITRIACSGQWMQSEFSIPVTKQDAQGYGSATTYIRRFAFMAAIGIAPEDDDGNAAVEQAQARNYQPQPAQKPISKPVVIEPQAQQVIAQTIDKALNAATGSLGAPFDLILQKGPHAGKQIQELTLEQAKSYFESIEGELKAINRSPTTLRGPSRDVFYALQQFIELKKAKA